MYAILNWEKFLFILTSYQLFPKSQAYERIFYVFIINYFPPQISPKIIPSQWNRLQREFPVGKSPANPKSPLRERTIGGQDALEEEEEAKERQLT